MTGATSPRGIVAEHPADEPPRVARTAEILIVVPCFNEAASIAKVLEEISDACPSCDAVVVDDGSTDDTSDRISPPAVSLRHISNLGIGAAVQTGLRYARSRGYSLVVQVDGDGQHPPDQVGALLAAFREQPANVIVGSRYIGPRSFRSTFGRRLGGRVIGGTLHRLYGGPVFTDPTSGMRLMDRSAIALFAEQYPHDYPEPISLAWALRSGLSVREVSVSMRPRETGESSIAGLRRLSYMIRVVSYILLARAGRRR
jgi:glycosyltransferase involved in cell wall biosynthesis